MPKPFDATLKDLIRAYPADWLNQLGIPITAPPKVLSAELSAVTAAADTLIQVGDRVVHIDVESGPDDSLARRMLLYNVLAHYHTGLPIHTVVVRLRSKAVGRNPTDRVEYAAHPGRGELRFRFEEIRVWELPANELLRAGLGLAPLAVLGTPPSGQSRRQAFPSIVERIADQAKGEPEAESAKLMTATFILSSMHVEPSVAREVINKVLNMKDFPAYQLILEEGAVEQMQRFILKLGQPRIGKPTEKQASKLKSIEDLDRLERMAVKVLTAKSWDGLLRVQ